MSNAVKIVLDEFPQFIIDNGIEIYNEFCLQHELGIYCRDALPNYLVQFERNVSYFGIYTPTIKKEIDISIFSSDKSERYAIELKAPRNGQHPEQMYSFIKDIKFMEQVKASGFKNAYALSFVNDKLFYEGNYKADSIYRFFRGQHPLNGKVVKPTGSVAEHIELEGSYTIEWHHCGDTDRYCLIEI